MPVRDFAGRSSVPAASESGVVRKAILWVVVVVIALVSYAARADDDLPGRVGRIAEYAGQLFLSPQERPAEWSAIGINYPITTGDNLWVSGDGRAEIDYGGGQFRLAGDTNLHVSRLDDFQLGLFVAQGRLIVRVRVLDPGEAVRVDTPNTQVALTRPGLYRIDVAPDGQATSASVREGEVFVATTSGSQQALPGQSVTVIGPAPPQADVRNSFGLDGFDIWSAERDRRYERGGSGTFVSRQMVGYAELDDWGTWETNPTYGPVWYPQVVAPDWAPYRDGYWTNVGGWGLTWVDAAPWGFAPSHYGRWVRVGGRWGWCPGAFVARPVWAPALVAWYGGAGWGVSVGGGGPAFGWVPLGWGDPYLPWWRHCSNRCWAHYNRPFAVNARVRPAAPPARYSNFGVPGAMTVVSGAVLGNRRPVPGSMVPVPAGTARSAPVLASAPPVTPGPLHTPAYRPGERGTPPPASLLYAPKAPSREFGAPAQRPAGSALMPAVPVTGTPPAGSVAPMSPRPGGSSPPQSQPQPRRGAPPAATPENGGTVVAAPPARGGPRQSVQPPVQQPGPMGSTGQAVAPPGRATTSPTAPSPTAAGTPMPSPRSAPAPAAAPAAGIALPPPRQAPAGAPVAAPAPQPAPAAGPAGRAAPPPPSGPAPTAGPQDRAPAKPADTKPSGAGKPVEREVPAPGTAQR